MWLIEMISETRRVSPTRVSSLPSVDASTRGRKLKCVQIVDFRGIANWGGKATKVLAGGNDVHTQHIRKGCEGLINARLRKSGIDGRRHE